MSAPRNISALFTGTLFGLGLGVSNLIDPLKVQNFLDVSGTWDGSLMLVLGGAVIISFFAHRFTLRRQAPIFAETFFLPVSRLIDRNLLAGAALFGIGWGLAGYCPGPGFAALAIGSWEPLVFVATMLLGFVLHRAATRQ